MTDKALEDLNTYFTELDRIVAALEWLRPDIATAINADVPFDEYTASWLRARLEHEGLRLVPIEDKK
jgi:hypothetical protein